MPRKSIVARLFEALVDILNGIRDVIVTVFWGKDALSIPTPDDSGQLFEESENDKTSLKEEEKNKVKERNKSKAKTKGDAQKTKEDEDLEQINSSALGSHTISFFDANKDGGSPVGSHSKPISEMTLEEIKEALSNEFQNEYMMNPSNSVIEIGGRYFSYTTNNSRAIDDVSISDVNLIDDITGTLICSMTVFHRVNENGEVENEYKMNDFNITDVAIFHDTVAAMEAPSNEDKINEQETGDTVIVDYDMVIQDVPNEEGVIYENKDVKSATEQMPKNHQDFMDFIKDKFEAVQVTMHETDVFCRIDTSIINPELPESQYADYKIKSDGAIFAVDGGREIFVKPPYLTEEGSAQISEYVQENIARITQTEEYKIYDTLSHTDTKFGNIDDIHYSSNGASFVLTNAETGKLIGIFENGEITFTVDADNIRDAVSLSSGSESIAISDVMELIKCEDYRAFETAVQHYSESEKVELRETIDLSYYTASRADREKMDAALAVLAEVEREHEQD